MDDKHIDIAEADLGEKPIIQRMMQLNLYDFSEFDGRDLDKDGTFCYKFGKRRI